MRPNAYPKALYSGKIVTNTDAPFAVLMFRVDLYGLEDEKRGVLERYSLKVSDPERGAFVPGSVLHCDLPIVPAILLRAGGSLSIELARSYAKIAKLRKRKDGGQVHASTSGRVALIQIATAAADRCAWRLCGAGLPNFRKRSPCSANGRK